MIWLYCGAIYVGGGIVGIGFAHGVPLMAVAGVVLAAVYMYKLQLFVEKSK